MDLSLAKRAIIIPASLKRDTLRTIKVIEKDRFDINFFSRIIGIERSSLTFKHFELTTLTESSHNGTEGLNFFFTNCVSVSIARQEWQKRHSEVFQVNSNCKIRYLDSVHCRYPLPDFLTPVSPIKLVKSKFRGSGESKFVPNFFDLSNLEYLDLNGSVGFFEMSTIWDTKPSKLNHLKLCFTDPVRFL